MNLRMINEAFKQEHSDTLKENHEPQVIQDLRKALVLSSMNVVAQGGTMKALEVALQAAIEAFFPDKSWWEVTDCNIFMELLSGTNPRDIVDVIINNIKPGVLEEV